MGAVFRSLSRTFSRHGKMKANFLLLIWLNEKVQKQRLKRERSGLRDRWSLCLWAKECAKECGKAYRLNLNTIISTTRWRY